MIPVPAPVVAFFAKYGIAAIAVALLLAVTFYAGKLHERAANESRVADAVEAALWVERSGYRLADDAEKESLRRKAEQLEKAHEELDLLRAQFKRLPRCPVPRDVVRMLDGNRAGLPATAAVAAKPGTTAEAVAPDTGHRTAAAAAAETVDAAAVMENCAWNRLNVAEPNAAQVEEIQRFYEGLRTKFNHGENRR